MGINAKEQIKKRFVEKAKRNKTPILGQYELTPRCNLDCKMCYVHNQDSNKCRDRELTTEQWKRIFDEAYDMGLLYATLTGGECLIRDDFKELYLHLWNKRVLVTVFTNGILLDENYVEFFKTYKPQKIQISLYGSDEEHYRRVTGHTGFEKATAAIRNLTEAGIDVRVSVTPSIYMGDDYINIIRFCKENNYVVATSGMILMPNRDEPSKNDYCLTVDQILELSKQCELLYREVIPADAPEVGGKETVPPKGLKCSAGNCLASITWDGKMYPCTAIIEGDVSLLELSYAEAWEKVKTVAADVLYGSECVGCPYDKTCPKCPATRLTGLHTGHCNPDVCEMTRRMVAEGIMKLKDNTNEEK